MDQEQQPTVWPPAPMGMVPTPQANGIPFKPAPVQWVLRLTYLSAVSKFLICLYDLAADVGPKTALFTNAAVPLTQFGNVAETAAFIAFLVWFYRVYKNLTAFEMVGLRYSAGWAVAWFFIPIFSIFRPYQMGQTIWKASSPDVDSSNINAWRQAPGSGLVAVWWTIYVVSGVAVFIPAISMYEAKAVSAAYYLECAGAMALSAAADVITIFLIRAVSARQQAKEVARFWVSPG